MCSIIIVEIWLLVWPYTLCYRSRRSRISEHITGISLENQQPLISKSFIVHQHSSNFSIIEALANIHTYGPCKIKEAIKTAKSPTTSITKMEELSKFFTSLLATVLFIYMASSYWIAPHSTPHSCFHWKAYISVHFHASPHIHPEAGDCTAYQNVRTSSSYGIVRSKNSKLRSEELDLTTLHIFNWIKCSWFSKTWKLKLWICIQPERDITVDESLLLYKGVQCGYCLPNITRHTWNKDMSALWDNTS
jgi:hypothetical protein